MINNENIRSFYTRDENINIKTPLIFTIFLVTFLTIFLLSVNLTELNNSNELLQIEYYNLQQSNIEICDINNELLYEVEQLNNEIENKNNEIEKLNLELKKVKTVKTVNTVTTSNNTAVVGNYGSKKTYMYYTSITNKSSTQWKVQSRAITNQYGIRVVQEDGREYVCIAIGTGWNCSVGTKVFVKTTNGGFYAIIGDIKANNHTTTDNLKGIDGSITEFIVDKNLNSNAKKMGNINVIADYNGDVLNITKI